MLGFSAWFQRLVSTLDFNAWFQRSVSALKVKYDEPLSDCVDTFHLPPLRRGKGHGKGVDYWALGILTYELLAGKALFCSLFQLKIEPFVPKPTYIIPLHNSKMLELS